MQEGGPCSSTCLSERCHWSVQEQKQLKLVSPSNMLDHENTTKGCSFTGCELGQQSSFKFPPHLLISVILFTAQLHKGFYWHNKKMAKSGVGPGEKLTSLPKPNLMKQHPKCLLWKEQSSNTCQRFAKHLLQAIRTQTQQILQTLLEVLLRWCSHQIVWSWKTNHKIQKKVSLHFQIFLQFEDWEMF